MSESLSVDALLERMITVKRIRRIEEVLAQRTRYVTVALEDIYQSQNASAVLRTCECFGVQDVHIIENKNPYNINPAVLKGSNKWLNIHRYNRSANNTAEAVYRLKSEGYRVVATSLFKESVSLNSFDVERGKFVIVLGNEYHGVSEYMVEQADECLKIPMYGFTQSFNLSVSAGIILSRLIEKLRYSNITWKLSDLERDILRAEWYKSSKLKL